MCIHHEEVSPYWRSGKGVGWGKLGDTCLSFGEKYTSGLKNLGRVVSHHGGGRYPCPLCENSEPCVSLELFFMRFATCSGLKSHESIEDKEDRLRRRREQEKARRATETAKDMHPSPGSVGGS